MKKYMQFTEVDTETQKISGDQLFKNGLGVIQKLKWIIIYAAWKIMLDFRILKPYENLLENL